MNTLCGCGFFELVNRGPEHAHAHGSQQTAERQRRAGLETLVAVGMLFIGTLPTVTAGE